MDIPPPKIKKLHTGDVLMRRKYMIWKRNPDQQTGGLKKEFQNLFPFEIDNYEGI
jgi:hypothetical protein